eukprot:TRINITY_DN15721_c0_g1_i4.p1 TRINITY_DN15721_c0_g1~~TRINITY_DN15721_c0_g1_i4.p1  ORF type:complete len:656 (+),score=97.01 TRINITY_DN15721_c0_g1_i4:294-1970(+)
MAAARAFGRWSVTTPPDPETHRELVFMVKQKNLEQVHEMLMDRSDPKSPDYGKWLSAPEIRKLTRNERSVQTVKEALLLTGAEIVKVSKGGEMLRARAPLRVWEKALQTKFNTYVSPRYNRSHVAAELYSIPESLQGHISGVLGCIDLPVTSDFGAKTLTSVFPAGKLHPGLIRQAYNMPDVAKEGSVEEKNRKNVSQAVFASLGQYWSPSDRKEFQDLYSLPERPVTELDSSTHHSDSMCKSDRNNCLEANLDVQYMLAMSPWSQMGFWYTDGDFTQFLEALQETDEPPQVISISYAGFEIQHNQEQIDAFNDLAMKLGVMGVTLIAASGDDGAQGGLWKDHDSACVDTTNFGLQVSWPASSPFVTAVGATAGIESCAVERTCQVSCLSRGSEWCVFDTTGPLVTSGGGISGFVQTPPWQKSHNPCERRGIPDVSLAGHSYNIIVGGEQMAIDGTSASAPVFGGMISLLNARRNAAGKPPVGFINPTMYQNPSAFNDIVQGDNKCGGSGSVDQISGFIPCCGGYDASTGWDAATGLGSVNFPKFQKMFNPTSEEVVV